MGTSAQHNNNNNNNNNNTRRVSSIHHVRGWITRLFSTPTNCTVLHFRPIKGLLAPVSVRVHTDPPTHLQVFMCMCLFVLTLSVLGWGESNGPQPKKLKLDKLTKDEIFSERCEKSMTSPGKSDDVTKFELNFSNKSRAPL